MISYCFRQIEGGTCGGLIGILMLVSSVAYNSVAGASTRSGFARSNIVDATDTACTISNKIEVS